MDLFKFPKSIDGVIDFTNGKLVEGWSSLTWIERYRDACEFTLVSSLDTDIRNELPIGSLISHVDSTEVMIVENHEISENNGETPTITITGQSFETFLEHRVVGANQNWGNRSEYLPEYIIPANFSWWQAVSLLNNHINPSNLFNFRDALINVSVANGVDMDGPYEERTIKKGSVYSGLIELLAIDNVGIRTVRPWLYNNTLVLYIHSGEDKSRDVAFSFKYGDIESANYLWSNKRLKNCAYVYGRWVDTFVDNAATGYDRRTMFVDASDLDNQYSEFPVAEEIIGPLIDKFKIRGRQALAAQKNVEMTNVKISNTASAYKYRADYQVGDLVSVDGDYNTSSVMRVTEHVEIEDETGESGYPTLAEP